MAQKPAAQEEPGEVETALAIARAYIQAGKSQEARLLLNRLLTRYPENDAAWLILLATNPPPTEEIAALQGMLKHHPGHRFRPALEARLQGLIEEQRIVDLVEQVEPEEEALLLPPRMRLGEFLVKEGWVTQEAIDNALAEQRRLAALGLDARLGTILLMQNQLTVGELAVALGAVSAFELGTFGEYLVRNRVLAPVEVAAALAHQSLHAASSNQQYLRQLDLPAPKGIRRFVESLMPSRASQPVYEHPPRLGDMLVQLGLLSAEEVERHAQAAERSKNALFSD